MPFHWFITFSYCNTNGVSGATYHSVEKQFRKIREIGEELKDKAELGGNAMAAGPGAKTQTAATRKTNPASTKEKTEGGRVTKATKAGANKKKGGVKGRGGRKDQAAMQEIAVGESANGEEALLGGEEDAYFDGYYDPELLNQGF